MTDVLEALAALEHEQEEDGMTLEIPKDPLPAKKKPGRKTREVAAC